MSQGPRISKPTLSYKELVVTDLLSFEISDVRYLHLIIVCTPHRYIVSRRPQSKLNQECIKRTKKAPNIFGWQQLANEVSACTTVPRLARQSWLRAAIVTFWVATTTVFPANCLKHCFDMHSKPNLFISSNLLSFRRIRPIRLEYLSTPV